MYEKQMKQDSCVRDSFVFYAGFYDALEDIHGEEFEECVRAVMNYALKGELQLASGSAKMYLTMAKPQIDANNRKYLNGKNNKAKQEPTEAPNGGKSNEQQNDSADFLAEKNKAICKQAHTKPTPKGEQNGTKPTPNGEQDGTKPTPKGEQDGTKPTPKGEQDATKVHPNVNDNDNVNANDNVNVNEKENEHDNAHAHDNVNVYDNECKAHVEDRVEFLEYDEPQEVEDENETHPHGEYKNVFLSSLERKKLNVLLGEELAAESIEHLSRYLKRKREYKSACHFEDLRGWVQDSLKKAKQPSGVSGKIPADEQKMKKLKAAGFLDLSMEKLCEYSKD